MPNLPAHLSLASQTASRLGHTVIDRHLGTFLLGSSSPDIRIMTKWKRDYTHFAPLTVGRIGEGAEGLFRTHPGLADSTTVSDETKAFLSGYCNHLVADETWILKIYRPYFDGSQPEGDRRRANIWDRALQLEMDRVAREELGDMDRVRSILDGAESDVDVGFIESETLGQWREWVSKFTTVEFTWDRLRFATNRIYRDDATAMGIAEEFLECVPSSLQRIYDVVPEERIAAYKETVIDESARLIKEYLGAPEGS